jgi:hypothetical protein
MTQKESGQTCFLGLSPWAFGPQKPMKMTFSTCIFDPAAFPISTRSSGGGGRQPFRSKPQT